MDKCLLKIKQESMQKTTEVAIYSHSSYDGVVGAVSTSKYNLYESSRKKADSKQMTLEGWSKIDFNFDQNNSIIGFYGCRAGTFAENFMDIHKVTYAVSHGGSSSDSEEYDDFNPSWFTFKEEKIYYVSPTAENNEIAPMELIKRGRPPWQRGIDQMIFFTNVSLDKYGNLYGWGKDGKVTLKKSEIKYYR